MLNIILPISKRKDKASSDIKLDLLYNVNKKPILYWALKPLNSINGKKKYTVICLAEDYHDLNLKKVFEIYADGEVEFIILDKPTQGMPCSVLLAAPKLLKSEEILISSLDQFIDVDLNLAIEKFRNNEACSGVWAFKSINKKWSYAIKEEERIVEVREKDPISDNALCSLYWFKNSELLIESIKTYLLRGQKVNNSYYLAPVYNEIVLGQGKVLFSDVDANKYFNFFDINEVGKFSMYLNARENNFSEIYDLTKSYCNAFNDKNILLIEKMFEDNVTFKDSFSEEIKGKKSVIEFYSNLFKSSNRGDHLFDVIDITTSGNKSFIEFNLTLNEKKFQGIDILDWNNNLIKNIKAYVEEQ